MRKLLFAAVAIIGSTGLQGCAQMMLEKAQDSCSAFGFTVGTTAYASCVQQEFAGQQVRFQNAMQDLSNQLKSMQPPPQRTITTTCSKIFNTVTCNSY